MANSPVSFSAAEEKVKALDAIASLQQRDLDSVLTEAVDHYLSLYEYHRDLIEEGLRQAEAGQLIDHADVMSMVRGRFRQKKTA